MDTVSIIELRQRDSDTVINDGDWKTTLREERYLNPGDSISIRNAFIDTKSSSSDTIKLEDDITLEFQNIIYEHNWQNDGGKKTYHTSVTTSGPKNEDGYEYILCKGKASGIITGLTFYSNLYLKSGKQVEKKRSTFEIELEYQDENGNIVKWHSETYDTPAVSDQRDPYAINIAAKTGTIEIVNEAYLNSIGMFFDGFDDQPVTTDVFTPLVFDSNITVPAGTYDPDDIARIISEKLSVAKNGLYVDSNIVVNSPFLHNSNVFAGGGFYNTALTNTLVRRDGRYAYEYSASAGRWLGTNQMALEYDNETQKFRWTDIHMPIYNGSGDIVTVITPNQNEPDQFKLFTAGKNSGIAFTKLEPVDFWTNTLGFNLGDILVKINMEQKQIGTFNGLAPVINLTDGVNVTSAYTGLDAAVLKNATFYDVSIPTKLNPLISTSAVTTPVYASTAFGIAGVRNGYFLVDIAASFANDIIGQNLKSHTISGIVSRYYSADSYTSAEAGSSIPYIHRGTVSINLDSLHVRILNPDGTLPNDIGDDNTVFLQIVRANADKN